MVLFIILRKAGSIVSRKARQRQKYLFVCLFVCLFLYKIINKILSNNQQMFVCMFFWSVPIEFVSFKRGKTTPRTTLSVLRSRTDLFILPKAPARDRNDVFHC